MRKHGVYRREQDDQNHGKRCGDGHSFRTSDRVNVLAPGSSVSVVPPTDLTYGSEVSVIVDEGAFLDMAGHETGLRLRPLPTKMCVLVYTDSALHNADADPDGEGSGDECCRQRRVSCPFPA